MDMKIVPPYCRLSYGTAYIACSTLPFVTFKEFSIRYWNYVRGATTLSSNVWTFYSQNSTLPSLLLSRHQNHTPNLLWGITHFVAAAQDIRTLRCSDAISKKHYTLTDREIDLAINKQTRWHRAFLKQTPNTKKHRTPSSQRHANKSYHEPLLSNPNFYNPCFYRFLIILFY
jgi:hypothetical protein